MYTIHLLWLSFCICYLDFIRMQPVVDRLAMPEGANCSHKIPAYLVLNSYKLLNDDKLFYENVEEDECKIMCSDNKDDKGKNILCASFNYDIRSRQCSISRGKATPAGKLQVMPAAGTRYYEKICLQENSPPNCADAPFFRANQAVLVGYAKNTTNASNLTACIEHCIGSKGECKSAMYFAENGECILNSATAQGAPDVFVEETGEEGVVYFENGCVMANQIRNQGTVTPSTALKLPRSNATRLSAKHQNPKSRAEAQKSIISNFANGSSSIHKPPKLAANTISKIDKDDEDSNEVSVQARRRTTLAQKIKNEHTSSEDERELVEFGQWAAWSRCDRPDGRRFRERKCPKGKRCRGLDIETQWCNDIDISQLLASNQSPPQNDASDLDDGTGLGALTTESSTASNSEPSTPSLENNNEEETTKRTHRPKNHGRHHRRTTTVATEQPKTAAPTELSDKWSPWSEQCRQFDEPNGCRDGKRLGFQTRQCLKSPFECQGPFFRYCITTC